MRRARMMVACGCALMAMNACTATANACFISFEDADYDSETILGIRYVAMPGEANRVTAKYDQVARAFTLTDTGAHAVLPDPQRFWGDDQTLNQCTFGYQRVTCRQSAIRGWQSLDIDLGDGDDTLSLVASDHLSVDLLGGEGNDLIAHAGSAASIMGGAGNDQLRGGAHDDLLYGGPGADLIDGRGGRDTLHYTSSYDPAQDATAGVHVTLDGVADDGMPGERDNVLASTENVGGTPFADVLTGTAADQSLMGFGGDDRVEGRGGADMVDGGAGDDTVDGGDGDDGVAGGPGSDTLTGGPGRDTVYGDTSAASSRTPLPDADVIDLRDGEADRFGCGVGADVVRADAADTYGYPPPPWWAEPAPANDCETLEVIG